MLPKSHKKLAGWLLIFCIFANQWDWQPALAHPAAAPLPARQAQVAPTTIDIPKWLDAPTLDGQCTDVAYTEGVTVTLATVTGGAVPARLVHSGLDFYLCMSNLPTPGNPQVTVQVDSDHSREQKPMPGDYKFSVASGGTISVTEGDGVGNFVALPPEDITENVAVSVTQSVAGRLWNAELRIGLEWFGGYARTDGLALHFDNSTAHFGWPNASNALVPATWGNAVLTPLYPDGVSAGSAFIDGQGGYLVVPYAPALNPTELTLEAWVKVIDGQCGTLVGNDQATSYWLALCQVIRFTPGRTNIAHDGQRPLQDGWHHVAVTMDADGLRSYYLDGQLDTQYGWQPAQEPQPGRPEIIEPLGVSKKMLRIGSDRTADSATTSLHGYLQDLQIWDRPLTLAEIKATIFQPVSPTAAGLLAWWPFTNGLQDLAGGHHAGLIGNAALAHATRDVTSFPEPPAPTPYTYPQPDPIPAWDAHIPYPSTPLTITVDGVCRPGEYALGAQLHLEPNRNVEMDMVLGADAFYLCSHILFGRPSPNDALTLLFNRDGKGGATLGAADLKVRLTPNGQVTVGNGLADVTAAASLVESKTISDTKFRVQEDIYPVDEAWWATEVRIPYTTLAPFQPTAPLHFAIQYDGTISNTASTQLPWSQILHGSWPGNFDATKPNTWGIANPSNTPASTNVYLPFVQRAGNAASANENQATTSGVQASNATAAAQVRTVLDQTTLAVPQQVNDQVAPTTNDFNAHCPGIATPLYAFDPAFKWPSVDPAQHPVVRGEGILQDVEVSNEDSPFIHTSHDLDMKITPDNASVWLMIGGASGLVLETESGGFPVGARPLAGDHITAIGRWIFDCGHTPKTEIHPTPVFESDSLNMQPVLLTKPGKPTPPMQQVRTIRVWMNSNPGPYFNFSFSTPFSFNVQMPNGGKQFADGKAHPYFHMTQGDGSKVAITLNGSVATVTITPPATTGAWYWELTLGWLDQQYGPFYTGDVFKVHLDQIAILDDHDSGLPDCGFHDCGEWSMTANINHQGQQVFWNTSLCDCDPPVNLNLTYNAVRDLNLTVEGYDDDDPFAGDNITGVVNQNLGTLASLCCGTTHSFQPGSDWKLSYHVTKDGAMPLAQQDAAFWGPRWTDEPNDESPFGATDLGVLSVPSQGFAFNTYNSFVSEPGLNHDGTTLLGPDVDRYHFTLADFADVTFGNLPAGLKVKIDSKDPWNQWGIPANVQALIGYKGAILSVSSAAGKAGDQPYTLQINRTFRTLPPDWGEAQDSPSSGRLVDLLTPEAGTQVTLKGQETPATRLRTKDWAWQHVANDIDYYDILVPPVVTRPVGQPACEFDVDGGLVVDAQGSRLRIPTKNLDVDHELVLTNLNSQFPDGHVRVQVEKLANEGRGVYQLSAEWHDGLYFNANQCALLRALHALRDRISGLQAGPVISIWKSGSGPDLVDPAPFTDILNVYKLGGYKAFQLTYGTALDANIASQADMPVIARLLDANGVLVAESAVFGETDAQKVAVPHGLEPQGRLQAEGLTTGGTYLLQFVPATNAGVGSQQTKIGVEVATQP